ncbi:hypothetical protein HJG60_010841 [Phyllostomus discolor]|uniref:Uncharacterized protein n=1 Tax=Phyllostomus discolor TaxID=89673 RepID=A0A834AEL8_9CHIR|nr:hypothetical protein HJG60_010841 [Phyllostomus discolor]
MGLAQNGKEGQRAWSSLHPSHLAHHPFPCARIPTLESIFWMILGHDLALNLGSCSWSVITSFQRLSERAYVKGTDGPGWFPVPSLGALVHLSPSALAELPTEACCPQERPCPACTHSSLIFFCPLLSFDFHIKIYLPYILFLPNSVFN